MKFLITGGAGFIGSAVIRYIINNTSDAVLNLDKLTYAGNLESLADVSGSRRYEFVRGDVCDRALLGNIFARFKPDIVMHLAAESHVDRSIDGPGEFIQTNIVGTYALLEEARNYWFSLNREDISKFTGKEFSKYLIYLGGNYEFPKPKKITANISNNHKKYAITWFSLAISILLLYLYFRKKNY